VTISPTSGPAGTPVTIHLKGVGWTDVDNIYVATYDNAYMGYACGFNSQGDVVINFNAAGSIGTHLIDFYPGIYQGSDKISSCIACPQLTYADDHPGNKIPALRFAFDVTPSPQALNHFAATVILQAPNGLSGARYLAGVDHLPPRIRPRPPSARRRSHT